MQEGGSWRPFRLRSGYALRALPEIVFRSFLFSRQDCFRIKIRNPTLEIRNKPKMLKSKLQNARSATNFLRESPLPRTSARRSGGSHETGVHLQPSTPAELPEDPGGPIVAA